MRASSDYSGDIGVVIVAVWMMVVGAWIALSGRFSITLALMVAGGIVLAGAATAIHHDRRHGRPHAHR